MGAANAISRWKPWAQCAGYRLVRHEYEDLMTFSQDELQVEADALERVRNDLAPRGMLRSGQLGVDLRRVRDESARRWRDTKRENDRRIEEIRETEGFSVKPVRKLRCRPWPENSDADQLAAMTAAWEDEDVRREAVAQELAPLEAAERASSVQFFPDEQVWDTDQAAGYRGQIGNRGADTALELTAQIVAETGKALADPVARGDLAAGANTQNVFTVECPHPRLYCLLSWRTAAGEDLSYQTNQLYPANPEQRIL